MARLEDADAAVAAQQALIDETVAEGTRLTAEAKAQIAAATSLGEQLARDRVALVDSISPSLMAEYQRRVGRTAGAALLRRATCEGCRMVLSGTDLNAIRQAPDDDVVSCPECGCILIRTEESGLGGHAPRADDDDLRSGTQNSSWVAGSAPQSRPSGPAQRGDRGDLVGREPDMRGCQVQRLVLGRRGLRDRDDPARRVPGEYRLRGCDPVRRRRRRRSPDPAGSPRPCPAGSTPR